MTRIHINTAPARKKPKAGDRRYLTMTSEQMFDAYFGLPVRAAISENTWSN